MPDLIDAHLAKAKAAVPARQHEKRGWWCCGINGGFAVSAPEGDHMTTIARGGSEPVGRHIAANDPATIEAFCAVAKAAGAANDYFQATAPCADKTACHECAEGAICQMVDALHKSMHALADALRKE